MASLSHYPIEIEFRALLTQRKYKQLQAYLQKNAMDLGPDDKNVFFFIFPDKLLKVVDNISQKSAKLVLKLNKIGKGSDFTEIEIPIDRQEVNKAVKMFKELGFDEVQESYQKRHNFEYKGVELAIKYSKVWGYHLELEVVIRDPKNKKKAEDKINQIAKEFQVKLMTDKELQEFTRKADENYKKGKY